MKIKRISKKIKILLAALMCIATLFSFSGCNNGQRLYIGFFANLTHAPALVSAMNKDMENAFGADTKIGRFVFNAGPALMEALRSGKLDVGYIGPVPAINGYLSTNGAIKIIAGVTAAGCMLVTAKNSNISDIASLDGKTVAIPQFNNTQDILLRQILAENGLSPTSLGGTVEIIQQDNASIEMLLNDNSIDAALLPEPWGSRLVENGVALVLLDSNDILDGNYTVAVIVARTDYINKNRDILVELLKEHINIINNFDEDELNKVNATIEQITGVGLEKEILLESYGRINLDYDINEQSLQMFADTCYALGITDTKIDISNVIDSSILEDALLNVED